MKSGISFLAAILLAISSFAQVPQKMSYQAVVRNSSNTLVTNQTISMRISIIQGSANGSAVYVETQTTNTNSNGLASVEIGGGNVVSGKFASIDWASGTYYIKTETDPTGGINYSIIGTSQLLSVPYAMHAKTAENFVGNGFVHYIGEEFGGGVIFHLWRDAKGVEHGLIVSKNDQSSSQVWGYNVGVQIGLKAQSSWDGLNNSITIANNEGNCAAKLCLDFESNGQSDWYLPSIDELSLMWTNRFNINKTLSSIEGATSLPAFANYWSSTEYSAEYAWTYSFSSGIAYFSGNNKNNTFYVRAIRAF